jgi:hypothetical protein
MSGTEEQIEIDLGDIPKQEAPKQEEPIVEIIDETQPEQQVELAATEEVESKVSDPEEALKKLQKKLDKERKQREEAEARARELEARASQASNDVLDSNLHLVGSAIETVRRDQELLKSQLKEANLVGDYDAVTNIQEQMTLNLTKLSELERGYQELQKQPRIQVQPVQPPKNPGEITVDDLIDQVTPRSQEWLKRNREHLPDSRSIRIMARAHEDAIDYGMVPESDAYFRFVENRLGIGDGRSAPEVEDAMSGAAKVTKNRQSPPSAPVSRNPVGSDGNRPGVIRLTAAEVEAAKISGISPQEYYKLKMQDRNRN